MALYWFMLIWALLIGMSWRLRPRKVLNDLGQVECRANLFVSILTFSIVVWFIGLRSGIADTSAYISMFNSLDPTVQSILSYEGRDSGFFSFSILFKKFISEDFHIWLFIIALISGICIMYSLYKYSPMFELSSFLFIATTNFTWMLNGMRQFIPASILFACIPLIINKKKYIFIVLVILLSTFHLSVIIMIPAYFLVQRRFTKNIIPLILFFSLFAIFSNKLIPMMEPLLENTQYAGYTEHIMEFEGSSIIRVLVASVPILIAIIKWKMISNIDNKILNICLNMSIINICMMIVSTSVGGIFIGRLSIYFDLYNLILYPMLLMQFENKKEKRLIYYLCVIFYILYFYYQMVVVWSMYYISDILNLYLLN